MKLNSVQPIAALVLASVIWGISGIYYAQVAHIHPLLVLAHRSIWAMIFFSIILISRGKLFELFQNYLSFRELTLLSASALMISINWFSFIFAIQTEQAVQASFGYYIFPLIAVMLGFLFKGERFSKIQLFAIFFAGISVLVLGVALKMIPTIALVIAISFGAYGLIKSYIKMGAIESVTIETIILTPLALGYIIYDKFNMVHARNFMETYDLLILMISGFITGFPLILFSFATKKLTYTTVGILQYINPTLQFLVAMFYFVEPFNIWNAFALVCVWIGIFLYSTESLRLELKR